jgi:hypothetical protein
MAYWLEKLTDWRQKIVVKAQKMGFFREIPAENK